MYLICRNYKDGFSITDCTDSDTPPSQVFGACSVYAFDNDLIDLIVIDKSTGAVIVNYHKAQGN